MIVYLNSQFIPIEEAKVSVLDRGFIFGDAVYEVWRAIRGELFEPDLHLARLANGLRDMAIAPPAASSREGIMSINARLMKENGFDAGEASLYLEITRGVAPRSHVYPVPPVAPTVFIMANAFTPPEATRAQGIAAICIDDIRWNRCNVKTTQLLPNVMAKQQATEQGATDAIFIRNGMVTESSLASVFVVMDGTIWTHPLNEHVLPSVTRAVILDLARSLTMTVREEAVRQADLGKATEMFLVGTLSDVMPIVKIDGRMVGDGKPGPTTQRLFGALRERLNRTGASNASRG